MRVRRGAGTVATTVSLGLALVFAAGCGSVPEQEPTASTAPLSTPSAPVESPSASATDTPTTVSPAPSETPAASEPARTPSTRPTEKSEKKPEKKEPEKPEKKAERKSEAEPNEEAEAPDRPRKAKPGSRTVYLTFDDGPSSFTPQVLDILARYDAKATFFVIGENVGGGASWLRRAKRANMSIQNHTWNHPDLRTLSTSQIRSQISRTDNAIRAAGGGRTSCVRPPYGATNAKVRSVLRSMGKRQLLWDIDTLDWERPGAGKIYSAVVDHVENGSVVLSHDGGGIRTQTVAALPRILKTLKAQGYRFGTVCD